MTGRCGDGTELDNGAPLKLVDGFMYHSNVFLYCIFSRAHHSVIYCELLCE